MTTKVKRVRRSNKNKDYVNNETFYLEMIRYKNSVEEAVKAGKPKPPIPNYIGHCIMSIANKLSNSGNFIGYSYRDEMIADGIENCIMYIDNFDPEKSKMPFAYFTQIIWFAFIRRIQKEKRQQYIKAKNLQMISLEDSLNEVMSIERMAPNDAMNDLISKFEETNTKKKEKKITGVEKFFEEEVTDDQP